MFCMNLWQIVFDNDDRDGQMLVRMNIEATVLRLVMRNVYCAAVSNDTYLYRAAVSND